MFLLRFVLVAFFSLGIPTLALASQLASKQLQAFNQEVTSARGEFTQIVFSQKGKIKQQGNGVFVFSRPGKFRWEIVEPFPQTIVSNGENVITYDPDLEQASIRPAKAALDATPSALLFGHSKLDQLFEIQDETNTLGDLNWLVATPINPSGLFSKIRIGWQEQQPRVIEIFDSLGQITRLTLYKWAVNTPLTNNEFELQLPENVDLLEIE